MAANVAELCEFDDALVDVDEDLEKVSPGLDCSQSLDVLDADRFRARASTEFFLV
jgi:hypothetical protein